MPDPVRDLTVVIVAYRVADIAQRAIRSVRDTGGAHTRLIVLDNSPEKLQLWDATEHHHHSFNPSLSRVWNWGLAMAYTRWVLVMNGDAVAKPGWTEFFCNNNQHFAECKLHGKFSHFMIDRSLIRHIGWFDEHLKTLYWEDTDFVRRTCAAGFPWCSDCTLNQFFKNERLESCHEVYKSYYDERVVAIHGRRALDDNMTVYTRKWGDTRNDPLAGGTPAWEVGNIYPCVELPE